MKRELCCLFFAFLLTAAAPGRLPARDVPPPADPGPLPTMPKDNPLPAILYRAEQAAVSRAWTTEGLRDELARFGVRLAADGRVETKVVGPQDAPPISKEFLASFGATAGTTWRYLRNALVPPERLSDLARALPDGYTLERARTWTRCSVPGEAPPLVHSDTYRDGGADGSGITVGLLDGGWERLSDAQASGDAPASYVAINYSDHEFESDGEHGTGCLEAVFDHAPGATYRLYKPIDDADWGLCIEDAIENDVDILSNSVAWTISGWDDDTGFACYLANQAAEAGILFFTSAGNTARAHYQAVFAPDDALPNMHDFDGRGDRYMDIEVEDGVLLGCGIQWDNSGGPCNLDLYLFDSNYVLLIAGNGYEPGTDGLEWLNETGTLQVYRLAVLKASGEITEFEIFTDKSFAIEYPVPTGSITSPANATHPNVIAVGAVAIGDYDEGRIETFSGQGPSNGGMVLPDLVGPDRTTGVAYPDGMHGTSNSTPNVAGAAAALWSADLRLDVDAIRWLLLEQAAWRLDWGAPGPDNVFGRGGNCFYEYMPNTLWVSRAYGNITNSVTGPLYTVAAAQAMAVAGGRILFFPGGTYSEILTLDKDLTYMSAGATAHVGPW
ncbi:MAG: S8 family serine peptidase [Krumholzibacteria bacterium]|nr:S8 family serine peptidase [Candidatus Krumholzibacteria bacterium]